MHNFFSKKKREQKSIQAIFSTMLAFGATGLIASFVLAVEEFHLLKNPDAILSCSFNLVLNCSAVMQTSQATVFGFPNMFIGLMGFPVVITIALLGMSNVKFPRWFLLSGQSGITLGALGAYWLFFNSVYVIEILCPWCLVVTLSMTMLFAAITRYNVVQGTFGLQKKYDKAMRNFFEQDYDKLTVAIWIVLLVAVVVLKFGDALVS